MIKLNEKHFIYILCVMGLFSFSCIEILTLICTPLNDPLIPTVVFYVIYAILLWGYILKHRIRFSLLIQVTVIILLFLYKYLVSIIFGNSAYQLNPNFSIWKIVLFYSSVMVVFGGITDEDEICTFISKCSCIFICVEWMLFIRGLMQNKIEDYAMTSGYVVALCFMFNLHEYNEKKGKIYLWFSVFAFIYIIWMASRGALLLTAIFTVIIILQHIGKTKYKVITILISTVLISLVFINYETILLGVSSLFNNAGYSSRNILKLLSFSEQNDSGRDAIYAIIRQELSNMPICGYGLCGEWYFIGTYSHNFIYDILIEWGFFSGIAVLALLGVAFYHSLRKHKQYPLAAILVVYFLVRNSLSSSYLIDDNFWCMIGILLAQTVRRTKLLNTKMINKRKNLIV